MEAKAWAEATTSAEYSRGAEHHQAASMAQSIQVEDQFRFMAGNAADKAAAVIIPLLLTLVTSSALDLTPQTIWDDASISTAQQQVRRWQAAHEHGHLMSNTPAAAHSVGSEASQQSIETATNQQPTSTPLCRRTLGGLHSKPPVEQGV